MNTQKIAFFVRLDRLGDLVLTLPSEYRIPEGWRTLWVIPKALSFVAEASQPKPDYISLSNEFSLKSFSTFYKLIRKEKPEASLIFQGPWWVYLAFFLARVPRRCAPLSKWYSFLFCNQGLRQKRSQSIKHEAHYNFDLVDHLFQSSSKENFEKFLNLKPITIANTPLPPSYTLIHPGMGGSALNWPAKKYVELAKNLLDQGESIVVTGTKSDRVYLDPLKKELKEKHPNIFWLDGQLSGPELIDVLNKARLVIAPSTGVLHLAASLGTPTRGIYSPIRVHHPTRWGPRGPKTSVAIPDVSCPETFSCRGEKCDFFPCMDKITVETVLSQT